MEGLNRFKNSISRLLKGESRTLISNFISLSLLQVAGYVFPLLTVPYLANIIGVNYYGEIAFAMAIMIYFQTIVDYGFIFSAVRDISRIKQDLEGVSEIYTKVMWARCFLLICSFGLLCLLILLIPKFMEMRWILLVSFLTVIGHAMFPDWMFQALEKMKYITIFNVMVKLIFTGAIFLFIKKPEDYILQPLFTALGYLVSGLGALWLIHKWEIKIKKPKLNVIFDSLKSNFDLFINQLVPNLYNSASILLLGFFHGNAANGVYDAANKFGTAGSNLFSIISRTFYPFLSRRMDKHVLFVRFNLSCAFIVSIGLFIAAPYIIDTFFPNNFHSAIPILQIISISLIFLALNNIYGTNFLILKGYERKIRQITLYSSIVGLLIGIPSVYYFSYIGVAFTITLSRGMMGIWSMMEAKKIQSSIQ